MNVLVDTSVWSLALRRNPADLSSRENKLVDRWSALVRADHGVLIGPIRQEILSGIIDRKIFNRLRLALLGFPDATMQVSDFECAAQFFNQCRSEGKTGSPIDLLICAIAFRHQMRILTADDDFQFYALHLPIRLL